MLARTRDNTGQQHGKTLRANHKQQNHQRGGNIRGTSWRTKGKSHYRPPTHAKRPHKGRPKQKENNLRSLPRHNQSLRQGVARRNHVRNAQKRTHKHPLASRKKPEPKPKSPTANKTWTHWGIRHQGQHQTRRSPISNTMRAPDGWDQQGNQWGKKGKKPGRIRRNYR